MSLDGFIRRFNKGQNENISLFISLFPFFIFSPMSFVLSLVEVIFYVYAAAYSFPWAVGVLFYFTDTCHATNKRLCFC